jgi:hypothetical protein
MDPMAAAEQAKMAKSPRAAPGQTSPKVEQATAAAVPPPKAPIDPSIFGTYVDALNGVFEALLPGEEVPPIQFDAVDEPVAQVPDDVAARTIALCEFLQMQGAKGYDVDPASALTTEQGMVQATQQFVKLSGDQRALQAITRGTPKAPAAKAEPEPEPAPKSDAFTQKV